MLHGPIAKKLLIFALPLALTGLLQQLFNTADVFVLGRFVGKNAMAAVGNNIPVISIIVNFFLGLSLGANVVIARHIGSGESELVRSAILTSLLFALISGFGVALFGIQLSGTITSLLDVPPEVFPMAEEYLRIYLCGIPAIALFNFEAAIFRSHGDTSTPLLALFISSLLNILMNLAFIKFGWGVSGVALATDIAYLLSALFLFACLLHSRYLTLSQVFPRSLNTTHLKNILRIGLPTAIQMMVFSFANLCLQQAINSLGANAMSASAAAFTIEINVYCVINSFSHAATTFVSQNYGAGNIDRCREVTRKAIFLDLMCSGILASVILCFATPLLHLFTFDEAVVELGVLRIMYVVIPEILNVFQEILTGSLRGYGIATPPAISVIVCICGTRLAWIFFYFPRSPTFETLMAVFGISWALTAIAQTILYSYFRRRIPTNGRLTPLH